MRTFDEINADINVAITTNDAATLFTLAKEMQALDTQEGATAALYAQGVAFRLTGDYPSSLENNRRALVAYEALGDPAGIARITNNNGIIYVSTGDYSLALESYHRALDIYDELNDRTRTARVTSNIGDVYLQICDYPSALEHHQRALMLFEELGDHYGISGVTSNIGLVCMRIGDSQSALEHFQRALTIYEEHNDRSGIAATTSNIGFEYSCIGDYESALEHLRRSLTLYNELGDRVGVARVTGNIIHVLLKTSVYTEAAELLEQQSEMLLDIPYLLADYHANKAQLASANSDLDTANKQLALALEVALQAGLRAQAAEHHEELRDLAQKRNDFAAYIEHNNEYQRITEEINGKQTAQRLAMMEAEKRMEAERKEREKERALLYGALPKSIADRMIAGEKITGDHFDHAAVLFTDVVGFTSHSSSMLPGDVVALLANMFSAFDKLCEQHGVIKVKTIGDSYMCFKGDGDATTNAQSVASLALSLQGACGTWPSGESIQIRIGIHIGPATAGVIGTERLQYDVWGDTVNVASRLESTSLPGRIHVSDAFVNVAVGVGLDRPNHTTPTEADRVQPDTKPKPPIPTFNERGLTDLKGKGEMLTWWMEG